MTMQIGTVALTDNCYWSDEFTEWEPVEQVITPTLTGALVVEESERLAGRPITIEGMWVPRSIVLALEVLAADAATSYTLTLPDARTFTVAFRRTNGRSVEARPIFNAATPDAETLYELILRFVEL